MKTVDYSNHAEIVAEIRYKDNLYIFAASDEESISEKLRKLCGDQPTVYGTPIYMDASSWCSLAHIGEHYQIADLSIEIVGRE